MADNADMNRAIRGHARRGEGVVDHLGDVDTHERRTALNDALAAAEKAIKTGDNVGRDMAEARIDRLFEEARAARQEPPQEAPASGVSFDGGVRRALPPPPPSMNRLILRGAAASAALAADARAFADAAF